MCVCVCVCVCGGGGGGGGGGGAFVKPLQDLAYRISTIRFSDAIDLITT